MTNLRPLPDPFADGTICRCSILDMRLKRLGLLVPDAWHGYRLMGRMMLFEKGAWN